MKSNQIACISFLGNAIYDSRVSNLLKSLTGKGISTSVISFDWDRKFIENRDSSIKIFFITKSKFSLLFYLKFSFLLLRTLLKTKAGYYFAEDIYTLPFVYFIGKIRKAKIIYDSRELYPFLSGLRNRKVIQWLIKKIEKFFITKVDNILTTGKMDSQFLNDYYGINNTIVLRNLPAYKTNIPKIDLHKKFGIPYENRIILYQGVLSEGRGIELIFNALKILPDYAFVILGEGAFKEKFTGLSKKLNLSNRVHFSGMIPQDKLLNYTAGADLGIALIENISKSYFYALPNKLFEYIMAGIPVIVSDLPQMKNIIETYNVGKIVVDLQPENIADTIDSFLQNKSEVEKLRRNCIVAAKNLNWEKEFNIVFPKLFNKHSFEND